MNIEKSINKLIIISSPSGAGKTTICKFLLKKMKNIELSISYTTRYKRNNEKDGRDYFFVDKKKFINLKKKNFFIESASIFNYCYGSPYVNINKAFNKNNNILFDIDWQGAKKIRNNFDNNQIIDFFILPPNKKVLKERLLNRHNGQEKLIEKRMKKFNEEVSHWNEYNYVVVNDDLNSCYKKILKLIMLEKDGIREKQNISFVEDKISELNS